MKVYIPKNFWLGGKENSFSGHEAFPISGGSLFLLRVIVPDSYGCRCRSDELGNSIFPYIMYCLVYEELNFPCSHGCDYETRRI